MYNDVNILGVTGRIASGKNFLSEKIADKYNYYIIDVDQVGHYFLNQNDVIEKLRNIFGDRIVVNGHIDKKILGNIVFNDAVQLKKLEEILHPLMYDYIAHKITTGGKWLINAAILHKMNLDVLCDQVWAVDADDDVLIERVKGRGVSPDKAAQILKNQPPRYFFKESCDRIILNNNSNEIPEI